MPSHGENHNLLKVKMVRTFGEAQTYIAHIELLHSQELVP